MVEHHAVDSPTRVFAARRVAWSEEPPRVRASPRPVPGFALARRRARRQSVASATSVAQG